MKNRNKEIDYYIAQFPVETRLRLEEVRDSIFKSAPAAEEVISYKMPAYRMNGILVWFAGYSKHIGFYPGASGIAKFKKQLDGYKSAKGSVQFPLDQQMPVSLIAKIVTFRVKENLAKQRAKKIKKS